MRNTLYFLGVLNDSDIDWFLLSGSKREVATGSRIIGQGQPVESLFIVLDGRFSVVRDGGKEIARMLSGEIAGEVSFVDRRPPAASVIAIEPSTVLSIPRAVLENKLANDYQFAARFYKALALFLSHRLRSTVDLLSNGTTLDADDQRDEVDPDTLDTLTLAGARFDWLQRRLKAL